MSRQSKKESVAPSVKNKKHRLLRVLIIEDVPADAKLLIRELERSEYAVQSRRVTSADTMRTELDRETWDVILADYRLPGFSAVGALQILHQSGLDLPFIIVSGTIDEVMAVESLRAGAHDFVMKGSLARLTPAVEREMREAARRQKHREAEKARQASEARFQALIENASDIISILDADGVIQYQSPASERTFGYAHEDAIGVSVFAFLHPDDIPQATRLLQDLIRSPNKTITHTARLRSKNSEWRFLEVSVRNLLDDPSVLLTKLRPPPLSNRRMLTMAFQ